MGCCGEEEEEVDDIFKQLIPHSIPSETQTESMAVNQIVISPMNSNFYALICKDILRSIFELLPPSDLARAACVCKLWTLVASDREIVTGSFKSLWKLKRVVGNPSSGNFWRDNSIGKFAISHRLLRGDSVTSLAVKYSVQVTDIKRLNNMMSEHGIYSRERLLIPVCKPEILLNGTCYIEIDAHAKREVAVMYLDGGPDPDGNHNCLVGNIPSGSSTRGKRRVLESMKRSMRVDDGTVEYYWSITNGDPRAAFSEFSEDLRWEHQSGSF
ncbi:hypothetical protein MKW94_015160 [Papaver nudicaule]|uniref:LysM domain-containing protein n=1 Tax=Papaver nudicaule TaxID=74823 RepID=A0AA41RPY0_PAPNU|nr:hypothetical protein [Papaver nudicaule]